MRLAPGGRSRQSATSYGCLDVGVALWLHSEGVARNGSAQLAGSRAADWLLDTGYGWLSRRMTRAMRLEMIKVEEEEDRGSMHGMGLHQIDKTDWFGLEQWETPRTKL